MRAVWAFPCILLGIVALSASRLPGQSQPGLRLTSPRQGTVVRGIVPIAAEASDDLNPLFVVFGIDQHRPVSTNTRPYACSWDTSGYADGPHLVSVEAYGPGGLLASTGPIQVIVRNTVPAVSLPVPAGPIASRVLLVPHAAPARPAPQAGPASPVSVLLAGRALPAPVRMLDGSAYIAFRSVVEPLGGSILWDAAAHRATSHCGDREVHLTVGSVVAALNGTLVRLASAPTIDSGRLILPARLCADLLGLPVAWDAPRRTLHLGAQPAKPAAAL